MSKKLMEMGCRALVEQISLGYMFKGLQIPPNETPIQKLKRKIPGFDQKPSFTDTAPKYRGYKAYLNGYEDNLSYSPDYDKQFPINPVLKGVPARTVPERPKGSRGGYTDFELKDALKRARYTGRII
jgi:hypothetical protein